MQISYELVLTLSPEEHQLLYLQRSELLAGIKSVQSTQEYHKSVLLKMPGAIITDLRPASAGYSLWASLRAEQKRESEWDQWVTNHTTLCDHNKVRFEKLKLCQSALISVESSWVSEGERKLPTLFPSQFWPHGSSVSSTQTNPSVHIQQAIIHHHRLEGEKCILYEACISFLILHYRHLYLTPPGCPHDTVSVS